VVRGAAHGYVQQRVVVGGRVIVQRTFVNGSVIAFRPAFFHGIALNFYAPLGYYPVGFYGWAINPWGLPIGYTWGWGGDPWFGYYGPYFRPFGVYPTPSLWLTDYLIARTLQTAFELREEARAEDQARGEVRPDEGIEGSKPISDDVKRMIAEEVRRQLEEAQSEARADELGSAPPSSDSLPPTFSDKGSHLYLASDSLEVRNTMTGESCVIGDGDAVQMKGGLPRSGDAVTVTVMASKGSDCPVNSTVSVPITEVVEMRNHMRETVEAGLETLRNNQGMDNLPVLPAEAVGEPRMTAFAASVQPDPEVTQVLEETALRGDQIERQILADFGTATDPFPAGPGRSPVLAVPVVDTREAALMASLRTGQTESQVVAIMGPPLNTSFLGGVKKQYEYRSGKVIFTDGEISEVESSGPGGVVPQQSIPAAAPASRAAIQPPAPRPAAPASRSAIAVGLSESEVVGILGQPLRVSFLGGLRKMYEYSDRKIIFTDGNVSEIQ
jgi:hypothetical protein